MGNWSSLRGNTGAFPSVVSTSASYFSFLLHWIGSFSTIIPRTLSSLYYTFLTLRSGQLALQVGRQVLHREVDQNNDDDPPSDLLQLPPRYLHLIWVAQTEELKPGTTDTRLFCHTSYHSLRGTNWSPQSAIEQLILTTKAYAIYPQQAPQHPGQTDATPSSSTNTNTSAARLKRKASSASIGKSRARKPNTKRGDDDNDNPNPRDPKHHEDRDDLAEAEPGKYFACHFFKLNPREYDRCGTKQLRTLDNLKQHLKRSHYTAGLPCTRCWAEFGDNAEAHQALQTHAARGNCEQQQGPDTLYDDDLPLLRTDRGSSSEAKWYQIWGQICDGHEAPESPYIELNGVDEFGGLIGREFRSRFDAHMPNLRTDLLQNPALTIDEIVDRVATVRDAIFSHSTLFETRYRRIFHPINTAQPTIEAQMDHEGQSDDGHDDDVHRDGDDGNHGAPPVMGGQPYQTYPVAEGDQLEQGWQPESPSEILFGPNHAEQRNQPDEPQSFEDQLGPPMFF